MDQTFRQLGDLLLGSIPTLIFFLLTYSFYRLFLHKPLERVLRERHQRTTGAMEKARADVQAAEAKTAEYEQRLREARLVLFQSQQGRRQKALDARTSLITEARERAAAMVKQHRERMEGEREVAQRVLAAEADRLASEVIEAILRPAAVASSHSRGGSSR